MKRLLIITVCIILPLVVTPQQNPIDSVYHLINSGKEDTNKVNNYAALVNYLQDDNQSIKAFEEASKGFALAKKMNFLRGQLKMAYHAGNSAMLISKYPEAANYYQFVIENADKTNNLKIKSSALSNLGNVYVRQGDFKKGMDFLLGALRIKEELDDVRGVLIARMNIGNLYGKMQLDQKALEEYRKCEKLALEIQNPKGLINTYINLANAFVNLKQMDSADIYYQKASGIAEKENDKLSLISLYGNIGANAVESGDYKKAEKYLKQTMKLAEESGNAESQANTYTTLSNLYHKTQRNQAALEYAKKGLLLSVKVGSKVYERESYNILYRLNKALNKKWEALHYYERYTQLNDSIIGEENQKQVVRKEMEFEFQKKEALLHAEREKEIALAEEEKRKQQLILWSVYGILLTVTVFSFVILRNYREKRRINIELADKNKLILNQKILVEEKQKEILDSILYAEQIQKTLIANHDFVNETIPDSFVMFRPKDIVSGDFYWATKRDEKFYLAVCDSTGHGVPGAFMSLLNISFLNEAINEKCIYDPAGIFGHVRTRLIESISQNGRMDGMDGVIVCWDEKLNTITYCAANNTPVLVNESGLVSLANNKMPVGKGERADDFTTHSINFRKGDMLYLFTDGYPDQFGGDKGKKFKQKNLQEILSTIRSRPVGEQKRKLEKEFDDWRGSFEQIDDVCLVGVRI